MVTIINRRSQPLKPTFVDPTTGKTVETTIPAKSSLTGVGEMSLTTYTDQLIAKGWLVIRQEN